ncbi:MAG: class I SAM-dependent methyltransferase [Acholeplasmataceae bacterium]|nr:class I SAM-dependent methyltransferase [Acholeplasmataceae bacterium]
MKEINDNKKAWSLLSKDHYEHYKKKLTENKVRINENILRELGDIKGKTLIHLQCNTGADTISLGSLGLSKAVGVDLSDTNVYYANKLASDFQMDHISFIESDVLKLSEIHHEKYDIVFTSEGVLGWLPDLKKWAKVVREMMKDDGYFYVYDSHPFFHLFDEEDLSKGKTNLKYDYFNALPDQSNDIGGYASEVKHANNYWWNHSISDIINALIEAGLSICYFNEFDTLFWQNGNMVEVKPYLFQYKDFRNQIPLSYSIKAVVKK